MTEKNFVATVQGRQIGRWRNGLLMRNFRCWGVWLQAKTVDREEKEAALNVTFELCGTDLFEQIITRIPRAQGAHIWLLNRQKGALHAIPSRMRFENLFGVMNGVNVGGQPSMKVRLFHF